MRRIPIRHRRRLLWMLPACLTAASCLDEPTRPDSPSATVRDQSTALMTLGRTRLTIYGSRFRINGSYPYPREPAQGRLMNVRMVNSIFEDTRRTSFSPSRNTDEFVNRMSAYVSLGVRAFTISLQGGFPGYEGAVNSAFLRDGSLKSGYLERARRVIQKADALGAIIILSLYYQRQDQRLRDATAVKSGVVNVARWIRRNGYTNVMLEIANEYGHSGFNHAILRSDGGVASLVRLAKQHAPGVPVGASSIRNGRVTPQVGAASDIILTHFNSVPLESIASRVRELREAYPSKPIVCNEDARTGSSAATAAQRAVSNGASYGLMVEKRNQWFPFYFEGRRDDPRAYDKFVALTGS
jgi:hypothetical protein